MNLTQTTALKWTFYALAAAALLSTVLTFLLVDLLQAFALLPRSGSTAILPMLHLFARETALSCLLLLPVYPALRAIRRIFPD